MENKLKLEKIIDTTSKLLIEKGIDGVSISDIQKESGAARGLLYHYFGGKDELFVSVIREKILPLFSLDRSELLGLTFQKLVDFYIQRYTQLSVTIKSEHVDLPNLYFLLYRAMQVSEEIKQEISSIRELEKESLMSAISLGQRTGEIDYRVDPIVIATQFFMIIDGVWLELVNNKVSKNIEEIFREHLLVYNELISSNKSRY